MIKFIEKVLSFKIYFWNCPDRFLGDFSGFMYRMLGSLLFYFRHVPLHATLFRMAHLSTGILRKFNIVVY